MDCSHCWHGLGSDQYCCMCPGQEQEQPAPLYSGPAVASCGATVNIHGEQMMWLAGNEPADGSGLFKCYPEFHTVARTCQEGECWSDKAACFQHTPGATSPLPDGWF